MFDLFKYEFKKLWNRLTKIAVGALVLIITVFTIITSYASQSVQVIKSDGEIVKGITAHRVLKEESLGIEGVLDTEYLENLVEEYNASEQKKVFKDKPHMMKYRFINYFINAIHYGNNMMPFYGDLDFDFLKSEEELYEAYKESLKLNIKETNYYSGVFKYTDKQMKMLKEKVEDLEFPLKVGYDKGLSNFVEAFCAYFTFLLIVLVFVLSTTFSKDTKSGVDELLLSSKFGRKKIMNVKLLVGNSMGVAIYGVYIGALLLVHGIFASLDGFGNSIQMYWINSLSNISFGMGILIMIFKGLLAVLIITNLVMLISIVCRNSKLGAGMSLVSLFMLIKLTYTGKLIQLIPNPIYWSTNLGGRMVDFEVYYFIGDIMIPYTVIVVILSLVYLIIIRVLTVLAYKRYAIK